MRPPQPKVIGLCFGASAAALGLGAFVFAASGIYNVAASRDHYDVTTWFLEFALRRSVTTHSILIESPPLGDADLVRLGAGHFHGGCVPCHGAPGMLHNPIVRNMLPEPPSLARAATDWAPEHLFWIVKNGLKYTGMPAWDAHERDDEAWAVVAFLQALPKMDASEYRRLAEGAVEPLRRSGRELAEFGGGTETLSSCARCHGFEASPPASRLVPALAGQSQAYLELALRNYADGVRPSGVMRPVAAALRDGDAAELAKYYAGLPTVRHGSPAQAQTQTPEQPEQIERGRLTAASGMSESGVPPCLACHGGKSAATFPTLNGQSARYIAEQLRLFQKGLRNRTPQGAIMTVIARRLTDGQIADVAAYFENAAPLARSQNQTGAEGGK